MRSLKGYELKAKTICINIQHEKGNHVGLVQFFDDQIKKYEFQLGLTPGLLDQSLVRENQAFQEQQEYRHKKPNIDERVDTLDLGTQPAQNIDQSAFQPPMPSNHFQTFDQNQTIKLQADDYISGSNNGKPQFETLGVTIDKSGKQNDQNVDDTLQGIFATLEKNDMSDTGANDQNPDWLFGKK